MRRYSAPRSRKPGFRRNPRRRPPDHRPHPRWRDHHLRIKQKVLALNALGAGVGISCLGRSPRNGAKGRSGWGRHFGHNVTISGPPGKILLHPSPLPFPHQIRGKLTYQAGETSEHFVAGPTRNSEDQRSHKLFGFSEEKLVADVSGPLGEYTSEPDPG
jgi:hypothetical protein